MGRCGALYRPKEGENHAETRQSPARRRVCADFVRHGASQALASPAASLTLAGTVDSQDGTGTDLDAWWAPNDTWSIGGGVGKSDSGAAGEAFSGTSLRLNSDLVLGRFNVGASASSWDDPDQLTTRATQAELGWTADNGLSISAIFEDRSMTVRYEGRVANQRRDQRVDFDGTGHGVGIAWFGEEWNAGVQYMGYGYGPSLARVRSIMTSATTTQFPRLQALVDSILTRAAGAPSREISLSLGRDLTRSSLRGQWLQQRDALTLTDINSFSLSHDYRFASHWALETTLGLSEGGALGTIGFGGFAITLRR